MFSNTMPCLKAVCLGDPADIMRYFSLDFGPCHVFPALNVNTSIICPAVTSYHSSAWSLAHGQEREPQTSPSLCTLLPCKV